MTRQATALAVEPQEPPMIVPAARPSLIEYAIERGAGIDVIERLMALKEREDAKISKRLFDEAMAKFKRETFRVTKDRENKQYGSRYTSLGNLIETVTPYLSKHGFSASWDVDQTEGIKVVCILTHEHGHSTQATMKAPPDPSGQKNPIQQIKSAITYAKISTFESVCGISSTEGGSVDDDANSAYGAKQMNEQQYIEFMDNIQNAHTLDDLRNFFRSAYKAAEGARDTDAMLAFSKAKDARKKELS